jgi:uncharacterized protein (DUF2252 family)
MRATKPLPEGSGRQSNVISLHGRMPPKERYRSADERRALGKKLRGEVPRRSHAGWKAPSDRRDPVDMIVESDRGRLAQLVPIRHGRMLQSPFAFYRGAAALMAADLSRTPTTGLRVQACGDAHLMNFGCFATPERNVIFDINDFDETLPAPWEWDLKRLAASVVLAGQHINLSEREATRAALACGQAYRERMAAYSAMRALEVWYDRIDVDELLQATTDPAARRGFAQRLRKARSRTVADHEFPKLAEQRGAKPLIRDNPPLIFHPGGKDGPGVKAQFHQSFALYRETLSPAIRQLLDRFHFCDLAVKVVGVGSVGTRCTVSLYIAADDDPLFLQGKEARASVLEPYAGRSEYANHGERVVVGQRLMQSASDIFLGWTRSRAGYDFYVRQLADVKIAAVIDGWDFAALRAYARNCAWALARAHARSGDAAMISGYMGSKSVFEEAIGKFAVDYAAQTVRDHRAFAKAVRDGRVEAQVE